MHCKHSIRTLQSLAAALSAHACKPCLQACLRASAHAGSKDNVATSGTWHIHPNVFNAVPRGASILFDIRDTDGPRRQTVIDAALDVSPACKHTTAVRELTCHCNCLRCMHIKLGLESRRSPGGRSASLCRFSPSQASDRQHALRLWCDMLQQYASIARSSGPCCAQGAKEIAKRRKCKVDVHVDYEFPPITSHDMVSSGVCESKAGTMLLQCFLNRQIRLLMRESRVEACNLPPACWIAAIACCGSIHDKGLGASI